MFLLFFKRNSNLHLFRSTTVQQKTLLIDLISNEERVKYSFVDSLSLHTIAASTLHTYNGKLKHSLTNEKQIHQTSKQTDRGSAQRKMQRCFVITFPLAPPTFSNLAHSDTQSVKIKCLYLIFRLNIQFQGRRSTLQPSVACLGLTSQTH